jgi:hypothetical protein
MKIVNVSNKNDNMSENNDIGKNDDVSKDDNVSKTAIKYKTFKFASGRVVEIDIDGYNKYLKEEFIPDEDFMTKIKDVMMEFAENNLYGRNRIQKKSLEVLYDEQENGEEDWEIIHVIRPKNTA